MACMALLARALLAYQEQGGWNSITAAEVDSPMKALTGCFHPTALSLADQHKLITTITIEVIQHHLSTKLYHENE